MIGRAEGRSRTAVIGAGLAGAICALDLSLSGEVVLFERELHPGGRLAAFRGSGFEFDSGAPFFMATAASLRGRLQDWSTEDFVARWDGWAVELDGGNLLTRDVGALRYVGVPNMAALVGKLAAFADLRSGIEVTGLQRETDGWWVVDRLQQRHGPFARVVCATPPSCVAQLLAPHAPSLAERAASVAMSSRWAVMLGYDDPLPVPFDMAYLEGQGLAWCGRNSAKPGRPERETWVLLATPEWSRSHEQTPEAEVIAALSGVFASALGTSPPPHVAAFARYWPEAEPINPLGEAFLADAEAGLYACGDWCLAPRAEGAVLSATELAAALEAAEA